MITGRFSSHNRLILILKDGIILIRIKRKMMNGKAILISIIKIEILGLTLWQLASIFSPYSQNIIPNAHGSVFNKLSIAIERLSIFDTISI